MALTVRIAQPDDANSVQQVTDVAFAAVRAIYRPNPSAIAKLATITTSLERLVAEESGEIVGTVRYGVFDGSLRVIGLAVLPSMQGRGVAWELIEALAEIAASRGCRTLSLYTVTQTGNVPIFQRMGFRVVSEGPDAYSISPAGLALTETYMERDVSRK